MIFAGVDVFGVAGLGKGFFFDKAFGLTPNFMAELVEES